MVSLRKRKGTRIHRRWSIKGRLLLTAVIAATAVMAGVVWLSRGQPAATPGARVAAHVPVIDAGHGGEDGGANSITGIREAEINLQVAMKTDFLMRFYGIPSVMTRTQDISLHDSGANTLREKKNSDLRNRVALVQRTPCAVLLSIHQNTYTKSKYSGLQAFYGAAYGSKELADMIQNIQKRYLDTNNNRWIAAVGKDVYLMNKVTCPAVLVECGFLTNPGEERRLREDDYQTKLAAVLVSSFIQWDLGAARE